MKFIWHDYLVFSLGICDHKTPTKTGLIVFDRENQELEGEKKSPDSFSKKNSRGVGAMWWTCTHQELPRG